MDAKPAPSNLFSSIISQVSLEIKGDTAFKDAYERVLKWTFDPTKRVIRYVPNDAWHGKPFDIDREDSERVSVVTLDKPKYWAFQLRENFKDPKQRGWVTEVGLGAKDDHTVSFGCRVICIHNGSEPLPRSIPTFVRGIAYKLSSYLDGQLIADTPRQIDLSNIGWLISFIMSPQRRHPIVVFSLPENGSGWEDTALEPREFMRRTVGFVHHAVISPEASFELSKRLGREFSVFNRGIRTYNPNFNLDTDSPVDHPVATYPRIAAWKDEAGEFFTDFLVRQTLRPQKSREILEEEMPSFQRVKQIAAEVSRKKLKEASSVNLAGMLELADAEILAARTDAEEWKQIAASCDSEKQDKELEMNRIKARYIALQHRLERLNNDTSITLRSTSLPKGLDEISTWADEELEGDVHIHPKALKELADSGFMDSELVYNSLLMLRDYYVPMRRRSGIELKNLFDRRCAELGLEHSSCFTDECKAKSFGDTYYRMYNGKKTLMNFHFKGSSSRDKKYGFRLYYFWDSEIEQVVVGHMPTHLEIDAT